MRYFLLCVLLTALLHAHAQEVCNNGKDDDGDGLIDLKDPDCSCKDSLPGLNYFKNASFEEYNSCPTDPNRGLGYGYVPGWFKEPLAADVPYLNLDCPYNQAPLSRTDTFPPPLPLPDGKGFLLLSDHGDVGSGSKYYAATCPENTLRANKKYSFECYIGFSPNDKQRIYFKPEYHLALFGNPDCNAAQYNNAISSGCPLVIDTTKPNYNWEQLGTETVYNNDGWIKVRIDFVPSKDINVLLIGPDCTNPGLGKDAYCYADNFVLSEEEDFAFKTITVVNNCAGGILLTAPPGVNASYQWYKDSIAIVGATGTQYTVPQNATAGNYNVRLQFADRCLLSSTVQLAPAAFNVLTLGNDTTLCNGETLLLKANIEALHYTWQDGSTQPQYTVSAPGMYTLMVSDQYGCSASTNIHVQYNACTDCQMYLPSAFTPNGDGKNDMFKVLTTCPRIAMFALDIYNRWGERIFHTNNVNTGWDGKYKGQPAKPETYIYIVQFKKYRATNTEQMHGTVTLMK